MCLVVTLAGTLEDVEICVLERVILGHKNFDVVFVNKDYKVPLLPKELVSVFHIRLLWDKGSKEPTNSYKLKSGCRILTKFR